MAENTTEAVPEREKPMGWLKLLGEIGRTAKASMKGVLPPEFWEHMRASHKEQLLAVRSLIDARIAMIEEREAQAKERKITNISVQ